MRQIAFATALTLALVAPQAQAEPLRNETLLQTLPKGFVIGHATDDGRDAFTEMIPQGERVENWSRMLTTQVMRGRGHVTPAQFHASMGEMWRQACPDARVGELQTGVENGYAIGLWLQACPHNPASGMPEYTFFKAIQGNDSFYVIQAALRRQPSEAEIEESLGWLRGARACDSRRPEQACPTTLQPASEAEARALGGRAPADTDPPH